MFARAIAGQIAATSAARAAGGSGEMTIECVPEQDFRLQSLGGVPVVTPPPEVDIGNADRFGALLVAAARDHATLVVDMTSTEFCDSSGIGVLAVAVSRARAAGGELRLVVGTPAVRKVLAITGMDSICVMFDRLPEAIAAGRQVTP
jgi:anti-sigma B factor antagonist